MIGRAIPEGGQFLAGDSFCGVAFLCCACDLIPGRQFMRERALMVMLEFFFLPPSSFARPPACPPLCARPLPAHAQRQQSMFLRMGVGWQYVNKNHFDLILGVRPWGTFSLSNYVRFVRTLPRSLLCRSTSSYSDKRIVAPTAINCLF